MARPATPQLDVPDWRWNDKRFDPADLADLMGGPSRSVRLACSMISAGCATFTDRVYVVDPLNWVQGEMWAAPNDWKAFMAWRNTEDARKAQEILALCRANRVQVTTMPRIVRRNPVLRAAADG